MDELGMIVPEEILGVHPDGHAFVYVAWDGHVRGRFVLAESWRPEASKVLNELTCAGIGVTILTGDANLREVPWQARKGLLPEEKLGFLEDLRQQGKVVAMVGDGINDGPALAASDVGIAMGCGADVARDAAGVCLLDSDLGNVVWAIELARQTMRVIRQNLFWAFAYNIVGIALACAGKLNPVIAALTMALSSMFVLVNSLRLATHAESPKAAPSESPQVALAEATP
jgi:P-type E1-E2 ATPase